MAKEYSSSLKIKRLPYSRLLKSEMADYTERVIAVIDEYQPKSVFINQLYSLLLKRKGDINLLRLNYGVDTERLKAKRQKEDMLLTISMFKLKTRMLSRSILESELCSLNNAIKSFLYNLHKCKNDKVLNQKVSGFFDMIANNEKLAYTIEKHQLKAEIDQVFASHKMYNSIIEKRVKLLSERPKVSSRAISKDLLNRIDHLFQGVELAYVVSIEADVSPDGDSCEELSLLIKTLNQLSEMFYKSAKLREQNNQRKATVDCGKSLDASIANEASSETLPQKSPPSKVEALATREEDGDCQGDKTLSKVVEVNILKDTGTPLLRCNPQKESVKLFDTKVFNADEVYANSIESSG